MSKITNDGLSRSGTGCFIAVPVWQQWLSRGATDLAIAILVSNILPLIDVEHAVGHHE